MYNFFKPRQSYSLTVSSSDWRSLHQHLIKPDRQERAAVGLIGAAPQSNNRQLFLHKLELIDDSDYAIQHGTFVELSPENVLQSLERYANSNVIGYFYAHSHPFTDYATFSAFDNSEHPKLAQSLGRFLNFTGNADDTDDALFVRIVCGKAPEGFQADVMDTNGCVTGALDQIQLVGPEGKRTLSPKKRRNGFSKQKTSARWDRNVAWMGPAGQKQIAETKVAIAGTGGAGAIALQLALGLGFRDIALIDQDRVEMTNLNRLPALSPMHVGMYKAVALAETHRLQYPGVQLQAIPQRVQSEAAMSALKNADYIFAGMDDDEARLSLQTLAATYLKPLIDVGSGFRLDDEGQVTGMGGQVSFYIPGGPCLLCQGLDVSQIVPRASRMAQQAVGYVSGTPITPAAAITVNSAVVSTAMDLLTRAITGFATVAHYVRIDLLHHRTQTLTFKKRDGCTICGSAGVEGQGESRAVLRPCKAKSVSSLKLFRSFK